MKNKKGFTLIELLAVIIVLGLIYTITTPIINKQVKKSNEKAFRATIYGLIDGINNYVVANPGDYSTVTNAKILGISVENIDTLNSAKFFVNDDKLVEVVNVSNGDYCANGTKANLIVSTGSCN